MNEEDLAYLAGKTRALLNMLGWVLQQLGVNDPAAGQAHWVMERTEAVIRLRELCSVYGDNDWPDGLYLADVIEKHLASYLDADDEQRSRDGVDAMGEDA